MAKIIGVKRLWRIISDMIRRREHVDIVTLSSTLEADDNIIGVTIYL